MWEEIFGNANTVDRLTKAFINIWQIGIKSARSTFHPWPILVPASLQWGFQAPILCRWKAFFVTEGPQIFEIDFGPSTIESKNYVNFYLCNLFFRPPAFWSSQNVFGPLTMVAAAFDFKDRVGPTEEGDSGESDIIIRKDCIYLCV